MKAERNEGFWAQTWRRFKRHRIAVASACVLVVMGMACLAVPLFVSKADSVKLDFAHKMEAPSSDHWFGTNQLGQDYFIRSLYGGRVSLWVGVQAMLVSIVVGTLLGAVAGYKRGWADSVVMRTVDVVLSVPIFFVLLILASFFKMSITTVTLIIGLTSWPDACRLVRAAFLSLREKEFVEAARAMGASSTRMVMRHLLPNSASPLIVAATLGVAQAIIVESALSYLGFGVQPPNVSWGSMLHAAQPTLFQQPWLAVFPGALIFVTVLAFNFLGDGLRDAMDPRVGKR